MSRVFEIEESIRESVIYENYPKLEKENLELNEKVKELTEQIEKMKNCNNCTKDNCSIRSIYGGDPCNDWELK